jgi:hypothetical protein
MMKNNCISLHKMERPNLTSESGAGAEAELDGISESEFSHLYEFIFQRSL